MSTNRITPEAIEAAIVSEHYFTAEHGIEGAMARGQLHARYAEVDTINDKGLPVSGRLDQVIACVLVLRNGATAVGIKYAPIDPAEFCAQKGREMARAIAISQVWPLEGYLLRQRLVEGAAA